MQGCARWEHKLVLLKKTMKTPCNCSQTFKKILNLHILTWSRARTLPCVSRNWHFGPQHSNNSWADALTFDFVLRGTICEKMVALENNLCRGQQHWNYLVMVLRVDFHNCLSVESAQTSRKEFFVDIWRKPILPCTEGGKETKLYNTLCGWTDTNAVTETLLRLTCQCSLRAKILFAVLQTEKKKTLFCWTGFWIAGGDLFFAACCKTE